MKYEFLGYPDDFEKNPVSGIILKEVRKGPVLDAGCGNGNLLALLKEKFEVEGFDISEVAVGLARKRGLKIGLANIENFRAGRRFKTILMIGLLMLTKHPEKYLKIAEKWLAPEGVIMLTIPNANSLRNLFGFAKRRNRHHLYYPGYFEFRGFLGRNGFEVLKCLGTGKLGGFPLLSSVVFYIIKPKSLRSDLPSQSI